MYPYKPQLYMPYYVDTKVLSLFLDLSVIHGILLSFWIMDILCSLSYGVSISQLVCFASVFS